MRSNTLDAARRAYGGFVRGTLQAASDQPMMQTIDARLLHNEMLTDIERFQQYGHTSVPLPPDPSGAMAAEVVVGFIGGNRSLPIAVSVDDRRHRPKNLKPGESARYDDQKQVLKLARSGYEATAKKHTLTAGDKTDTESFELNEQLKGLAARVAQAETNLHGLFDVTSKLRQIAQGRIPELAAIQDILNQAPSGLDAMEQAISGQAQAYLQKQVEQALAKFLSPNLSGLSSLLSGGLEKSISDLQAQIADLATKNPVVGVVDDLQDELANLSVSGAAADVIKAGTAALQAKIGTLTSANPIVASVAGLRTAMQDLIAQAGPALNFLAPQQRLVQGISKSLRLGGPG